MLLGGVGYWKGGGREGGRRAYKLGVALGVFGLGFYFSLELLLSKRLLGFSHSRVIIRRP